MLAQDISLSPRATPTAEVDVAHASWTRLNQPRGLELLQQQPKAGRPQSQEARRCGKRALLDEAIALTLDRVPAKMDQEFERIAADRNLEQLVLDRRVPAASASVAQLVLATRSRVLGGYLGGVIADGRCLRGRCCGVSGTVFCVLCGERCRRSCWDWWSNSPLAGPWVARWLSSISATRSRVARTSRPSGGLTVAALVEGRGAARERRWVARERPMQGHTLVSQGREI